jgi:hypothetical protein
MILDMSDTENSSCVACIKLLIILYLGRLRSGQTQQTVNSFQNVVNVVNDVVNTAEYYIKCLKERPCVIKTTRRLKELDYLFH